MEIYVLIFVLYVCCAFLCHIVYKIKAKILNLVLRASPTNKKKEISVELDETYRQQSLSLIWPYVLFLEIRK